MALATSTSQVDILKRLYGKDVAKPMYDLSKLLELSKKDTEFRGELRYVAVNIAPTTGGSATFADAVAAQDPTRYRRFQILHRREYKVWSLENEFIQRSKGNTGALVDGLKREIEGARQEWAERFARRVWGNQGGSIGRIDAAVNLASTTLTFRDRTSVIGGINVGSQLQFASDDGSAANPAGLRTTATLTVTAVNRDTGAVTVSANLNTIPNITVNDWVFIRGDYASAMSGLPAWIPTTAPTGGDSFFSVDRTVDILRLSGFRVTGGGKPKEETLQDAGAEAHINGCRPKHCFMNPLDFKDLVKELGPKVTVSEGKGYIGMKTVTVFIATGEIEVISEPYCPRGYAWLGDAGQFVLGTAGECPMLISKGAGPNDMLLLDNADAFQGRFGAYGNFWISDEGKGPGGWGVIAW